MGHEGAGGGEAQLLGGADDQLGAQLMLQRAQVGADRGLGEVESLGGPRKALQTGDLGEYLQLLELHIRLTSFAF